MRILARGTCQTIELVETFMFIQIIMNVSCTGTFSPFYFLNLAISSSLKIAICRFRNFSFS